MNENENDLDGKPSDAEALYLPDDVGAESTSKREADIEAHKARSAAIVLDMRGFAWCRSGDDVAIVGSVLIGALNHGDEGYAMRACLHDGMHVGCNPLKVMMLVSHMAADGLLLVKGPTGKDGAKAPHGEAPEPVLLLAEPKGKRLAVRFRMLADDVRTGVCDAAHGCGHGGEDDALPGDEWKGCEP